MSYDYLVVGCGLFGTTFAREMTDCGKKCLIIDKRSKYMKSEKFAYKKITPFKKNLKVYWAGESSQNYSYKKGHFKL